MLKRILLGAAAMALLAVTGSALASDSFKNPFLDPAPQYADGTTTIVNAPDSGILFISEDSGAVIMTADIVYDISGSGESIPVMIISFTAIGDEDGLIESDPGGSGGTIEASAQHSDFLQPGGGGGYIEAIYEASPGTTAYPGGALDDDTGWQKARSY